MNIPKSCRRPVVSLLYATKSCVHVNRPLLLRIYVGHVHFAFPVTFLRGGHVLQIAFGQISLSASSSRDLGTRLVRLVKGLKIELTSNGNRQTTNRSLWYMPKPSMLKVST